MYSVTVMMNVIEFYKINKPVLHSFHIRWTFVIHSIFGFMLKIRSYTENKDFAVKPCSFSRNIVLCFMSDGHTVYDILYLSFTLFICHWIHKGCIQRI